MVEVITSKFNIRCPLKQNIHYNNSEFPVIFRLIACNGTQKFPIFQGKLNSYGLICNNWHFPEISSLLLE